MRRGCCDADLRVGSTGKGVETDAEGDETG